MPRASPLNEKFQTGVITHLKHNLALDNITGTTILATVKVIAINA